MLKKMIENNEIPQHLGPKQVYQLREEFQSIPLDNFRNGLNRVKAQLGFHLRKPVSTSNGKFFNN